MSGYWAGISSILAINIVLAYAVFLPVATGQLNLGAAGFQAVGAYTAGYLSVNFQLPITATLPLAIIVTGAVSFLIAFPILRTRGVYLVLATFAFAEMVGGIILNSERLGGPMGLSVPAFIDYHVPAALALIVTLLVFYLMSTRFGLAMRATHDDEVVTDLMGVNVRGVQVAAFSIGGALAGLAGGLYAHAFNFIELQSFNSMVSIYVLLYVLIGGTQTAWGPLVGATFFTLLPEILRTAVPAIAKAVVEFGESASQSAAPADSWRFIILGILTIIMMLLRPEGIVTRTLVEKLRFTHTLAPSGGAG